MNDLTAQQFGRLTVLGLADSPPGRRAWVAHCQCGQTVRADDSGHNSEAEKGNVHLAANDAERPSAKTQCAAEWSRELGINHSTIAWRIRKGWSVEAALTPVRAPGARP